MSSPPATDLSVADKLCLLQRLDHFRQWQALDDQRQCIQCGEIISGREIEIAGGTRETGPLRLQCPTPNCPAIPFDWILPDGGQCRPPKVNLLEPVAATEPPPRTHSNIGKVWSDLRRGLGLA